MSEDKYFDEEFSALAEKLLARYHVPSISVAVVDNGRTYSKAYGLARFPSTPATPDTLYCTGSTTKAMLAAALGVAIHNPDKVKIKPGSDDPLSWTTSLRSVLGDDFTLDGKYITENATIEDSLSHRIGFSGHEMIYGQYLGDRPRELTKRLRYLGPPNKQFRTDMQYNNFMYAVAGDVLETITEATCSEALRDHLWKPLGMDRTFYHLKEAVNAPHIDIEKHLSRGYFWVNGSKADDNAPANGFYVPNHYHDLAGVSPAGSVISSVNEYAKWMQALLDAASSKDSSSSASSPTTNPITNTLFKELTSSRITSPLPLPQNSQLASTSWGLGWNIIPALLGPFHPLVTHSGGLPGYGTMLYLLPNDSFGVTTIGNTGLTANLVGGILAQELMLRKLDVKSPGREQELRQFNTLMRAQLIGLEHCIDSHPDDSDTEDIRTMLKNTAFPAGSKLALDEYVPKTDDKARDIQALEGTYMHGAYGSFRVTFAPAASDSTIGSEKLDGTNLTNRFPRDKKLNETKNSVRGSCHSLRIQPVGRRCWNYTYLLHPRVAVAKSQIDNDKDKDKEGGSNTDVDTDATTWFDQEWLCGHGSLDHDVVPDLPSGVDGEDGDGTGKCRQETTWESVVWTRLGAAFVRDGDGTLKMVMTLGNTQTYADGTREKGWEDSKVWFVKEG